jgi:hypothetical protein
VGDFSFSFFPLEWAVKFWGRTGGGGIGLLSLGAIV